MNLEEYFHDFMQDIYASAEAGNQFTESVFVEHMCDFLVEQAILEEYAQISYKKDSVGLKVDAYEYLEDSGSITLLVSYFREQYETLTQTDAVKIFKIASKFFQKSLEYKFHTSMEESDPAYSLAQQIYNQERNITKVKIIILTNSVISNRMKSIKESELAGYKCFFDIWDIERIFRVNSSGEGKESIVINFEEDFGHALPCLPAFTSADIYQSYLLAIPGEMLATLYEKYGERLLEQNVRTFLQFRGKVNKGIRNTIQNEPEMFFAYNNGITATAEEIEICTEGEHKKIRSMKNLQVVNGGQTTASLYTVFRKSKADLSNVYVQVKLTIIPPEQVEQVVPRISEYANTQNKVNAADFFSNHPFHLRIEEFSRRIWAPSPEGGLRETHWFYERARGQYANAQANLTPARKKEFLAQNPRGQMITKTDFSKFHYSWEKLPHIVSLGAQKSFAKFAADISKEWERNEKQYNELYFKEAIAKAILFRHLDKLIMKQSWYGGYKANIVTYTISKLRSLIDKTGRQLDLETIWRSQALTTSIIQAQLDIAEVVNRVIQDTPEGITNVTEWCKKEQCWSNVLNAEIDLSHDVILGLANSGEITDKKRTAEKVQEIDNGIDAQKYVLDKGAAYWLEVRSWGRTNSVITPKEDGILNVGAKIPNKIPTEKQALVILDIEKKVIAEGFPINHFNNL